MNRFVFLFCDYHEIMRHLLFQFWYNFTKDKVQKIIMGEFNPT